MESGNSINSAYYSSKKFFAGSESFGGDIENETIKLAAELKSKK